MAGTLVDPVGSAPDVASDGCWLACIECGAVTPPFDAIRYTCESCGGLLEVRYERVPGLDELASTPGDGVWRFRDALPVTSGHTLGEGETPLYRAPTIEADLGIETLRIKHEGANPTGSFKDRGMTVGAGVARRLEVGRLGCASTGNTSAALAAYGARAGLDTVVLLPAGKVARGKLAQTGLHGARILEVDGNFDDCLDIVQRLAERGELYLLNSVNPFRLEGQKTIGLEILLSFMDSFERPPDRICLPVGNAGNVAALYKAFRELVAVGSLEADELPMLTGVQAEGAAPFVEAIAEGRREVRRWADVETHATAIRIGHPVNAPKALPGIRDTGGTAVAVDESAITAAQRELAQAGIGVEPASAASLAGLRRLRAAGEVDADERVVCLTTGHLLKDPDAASAAGTEPEAVPADIEAVLDRLAA